MKHADHDHREQRERRRARGRRSLQDNVGSDRRWIEGKDVHLAGEIRYIQQRAAERDTRIVTIGPLLLFSAESGDAWMLDPADRLATRLAEAGNPRLARVEETEESFAVGWQGRYEIIRSAFVFSDNESGRVTTFLGYPTRQIIQRITEVFGC
jgi:hypothetical protein